MNDIQMWVIIGVGILVAATVIIMLFRRGGSVGTKQLSIYIPEAKKRSHTPLGSSLQYLYDVLPIIRQEYEAAYFNLVKKAGIPEAGFMSHQDVKYFIQMSGNFIYSGNGIHSVKTILEQVISSKEWADSPVISEFHSMIIKRVFQTVNKYNNQNYDDFVMQDDGTLRERLVNSVTLFKKLDTLYRHHDEEGNSMDGPIAKIIVEIIDHAIDLESGGKK